MARQRPVHAKPEVYRRARAIGELSVSPGTLQAIMEGTVEKGDPLGAAEIAGLMAMKGTSRLIPHCHAIPLTGSAVEVAVDAGAVRAEAEAETLGRTGVEMEALVGATVALLTVWDMVKYLEKDENGLYPNVRLGPVRVVEKRKGREEST